MKTATRGIRLSEQDNKYLNEKKIDVRKIIEDFITEHKKHEISGLLAKKEEAEKKIKELETVILKTEETIAYKKECKAKQEPDISHLEYRPYGSSGINIKKIAEERERRRKEVK